MGVDPEFSSISDARTAYYGDDGEAHQNNTPGDRNWGDPQRDRWLGGDPAFALVYQDHQTDDTRRWFVYRGLSDGTVEAINKSGELVDVTQQIEQGMANVPHYDLEQDALDAYNKWAENNDAEQDDGGTDNTNWGEWQRLRQREPWWVFSRAATNADRVQFCIAGKRDGNAVYLQPDGSISTDIHLYDDVGAVSAALEAYFNDPPDNPPTGEAPSRETIKQASSKVHTSQSKMIEKLGGKKALVAAMGVAGLAVLSRAGGDN